MLPFCLRGIVEAPFQLVGISQDGGRIVKMTGTELAQANAARDAIQDDSAFLWVQVEREARETRMPS